MRFLTVLFSLLLSISLNAQSIADYKTTQSGVTFTENKGQVSDQHYNPRPDVLYSGNSGGLNFHIRTDGISYQMTRIDSWKEDDMGLLEELAMPDGTSQPKDSVIDQMTIYRTDINWIGARSNFEVETGRAKQGYNNYYLPTCPDGALNVLSYDEVTFKNLYEGIDLKWYSNEGALEYDFIVSPNTDYSQIKWEIQGAEQIAIGQEGQLIISTPLGKIEEQAPIAYQGKQEVEVEWTLTENQVGFSVKDYNQELPLRIDPVVLAWGTYFGGELWDFIHCAQLNSDHDLIVSGQTNSTNNIATSGVFQTVHQGSWDGFVASFDQDGTRDWCTYFGGLNNDILYSISVTPTGFIYSSGETSNSTGIASSSCHQEVYGGSIDAILLKLDSSGQRKWSTYYGGDGLDRGWHVESDQFENVFLMSATSSDSAISTSGAHQEIYQGGNGAGFDAYLVKFDSSGTRLWGTYFGGAGEDIIYGADCDVIGNIYVVGNTSSNNGVSTSGSLQTTTSGSGDMLIAKFSSVGDLIWGSYYGGSGWDEAAACDYFNGNLYVGGRSSSSSLATSGSYQINNSGNWDGIILKIDSSGNSMYWCSYVGGSDFDWLTDLKASDADSSLWFSGFTNSTDFPVNSSLDSIFSGVWDGIAGRINLSGSELEWSTFMGGTEEDRFTCVAIDSLTSYFVGYTYSDNASLSTPNVHQVDFDSIADGVIWRINGCFDIDTTSDNIIACDSLLWIDGIVYSSSTDSVFITVLNSLGCTSVIRLDLTIFNSDSTIDHQEACGEFTWIDGNMYTSNNNSAQFTLSTVNGCDSVVTLDLTILNADTSVTSSPPSLEANADSATYQWIDCSTSLPIDSATSQVFVAQNNGSYAVVVTQNGCTDTSSCYQINNVGMESLNGIEASVFPNPSRNNITIQCSGEFDFKVLSIDGKTVLSGSGLDAVNCELAEFPRGQYTIVVSQAGKANQYKVILN